MKRLTLLVMMGLLAAGFSYGQDWDNPEVLKRLDLDEQEALRGEEAETLLGLFRTLPSADRQLILMKDVDGFTIEEVAEILGILLGTVKSRLHRAREKLLRAARSAHAPGGVSRMRGVPAFPGNLRTAAAQPARIRLSPLSRSGGRIWRSNGRSIGSSSWSTGSPCFPTSDRPSSPTSFRLCEVTHLSPCLFQ
jgi:hypothetical protein